MLLFRRVAVLKGGCAVHRRYAHFFLLMAFFSIPLMTQFGSQHHLHDFCLQNPGGFVYRGQRYADILEGAYIFADQVTR